MPQWFDDHPDVLAGVAVVTLAWLGISLYRYGKAAGADAALRYVDGGMARLRSEQLGG